MLKSDGCRCDKQLPASLIAENRISGTEAALIAGLFFVIYFAVWLCGRELLNQEGLFAACANEYRPGFPVTAHGMVQHNIQPLFPATVALLVKLGLPMESALRLPAAVMLAGWSILAGASAARRRNFRAGIVTFFCCAGTIFAMGKGIFGQPVTMTAFFLLAGQLVFFHYGNRLANWNKAWLGAAVLWILAFLSGGPIILPYIIIPILFLRRPLSVNSKFNTPGFLLSCILMGAVIVWRILQAGLDLRMNILPDEVSGWEYIKHLITYPLVFPIRLFPWSILTWLPFCMALQAIDPTPVFSKYLRTLFTTSFILSWLIPDRPGLELFYVAGPLAIMTGLNYDLGIRRYWKWFRKVLIAGELLMIGLILAIIGIIFLPDDLLQKMFNISPVVLHARYRFIVLSAALLPLILLTVSYHLKKRTMPIWQLIAKIMICCAIFSTVVRLPVYLANRRWQKLGKDIASALPESGKCDTLYKLDISGMYCGLFYAGIPVKKIRSLDELPTDRTIYLISSGFPRHFGWRWTPLLPPDYRFEGEIVSMWCGEPVPPENSEDEDLIQ